MRCAVYVLVGMMNRPVLGFDPSLVSSGFSYTDIQGEIHTGRIRPKTRFTPRLDYISDAFENIIEHMILQHKSAPLVVYEGYSMGSPKKRGGAGRFYDIGEQGGVLKLIAYRKGIDVLLVPPNNLKKFATGSGGADKDRVIASVAEVWGYDIPRDDEADAFVLMQMGLAYDNSRKARQTHRKEALKGCSIQLCK